MTSLHFLTGFLLGAFSGVALTLMDRIDEHHIIEKNKIPLAYLAGIIATGSVAWTLELFPVLYSLPFVVCVEWILKNKIDYPSHVFALFLLALYFGWRIDLVWLNLPYISLFLVLRFLSGTYLRKKVDRKSEFFRWYYQSYWEKFICNIVFAIALSSFLVLFYSAGVALACLYTKRLLPEKVSCT